MDKRELLDRIAATGEERLLLGRIWDKWEQCQRRNIPAVTGFLSPQEQALAHRLLSAMGVMSGFLFWGGYDGAERCQLQFLPDWQEEAEDSIHLLRCNFYEEGALTHRDFLGSLMGMGLTREKIGDILVTERSADILVGDSVSDFLLQNWNAAGRIKLKVTHQELHHLHIPQQQTKEIHDTVPSLRLDCMVAAGFSTSRVKAAEAIAAGRVQVNWTTCQKSDAAVAEGDVISVRGMGKCRLESVGKITKKGRVFVTLQRYI